ncbi:MAG: o-succinylbenzoate synthase [Deltaproteobacteria bacterium]|nr:o-succinylbenzoate synthase [Deltaproteobacteria bacterium]
MSDSFQIEEVVLRVVKLPLKEPFTTSLWTTPHKTPILVEMRGQGISGWGEGAVPLFPFYNHETPQTVLHILRDFALPLFFKEKPKTPPELAQLLKRIQRNGFARAALEMAYWDWTAKAQGKPLYQLLGGARQEIPVGVSVGIQKDTATLLKKVGEFREQGYQRIKIKIAPGKDLEPVKALLTEFPGLPLMVDANSAYTLKSAAIFREMNQYPLLMIEQPLHETDIYEHSLLQKELSNPICLDESIESLREAEAAIALRSCKIINIKPGRVAGLTESVAIHDYCQRHDIPVWCGGMLESGIGRATNMALATLPNFRYPGDISESSRYYHEDIVEPDITLRPGGTLQLPSSPGIGFEVNMKRIEGLKQLEERFRP